jgi:hypothetical protein
MWRVRSSIVEAVYGTRPNRGSAKIPGRRTGGAALVAAPFIPLLFRYYSAILRKVAAGGGLTFAPFCCGQQNGFIPEAGFTTCENTAK